MQLLRGPQLHICLTSGLYRYSLLPQACLNQQACIAYSLLLQACFNQQAIALKERQERHVQVIFDVHDVLLTSGYRDYCSSFPNSCHQNRQTCEQIKAEEGAKMLDITCAYGDTVATVLQLVEVVPTPCTIEVMVTCFSVHGTVLFCWGSYPGLTCSASFTLICFSAHAPQC